MPTIKPGAFALVFAFLFTCVTPALAQEMITTLVGSDGQPKGNATITPAYNGILVHAELAGLPAGWHGMHFHEKASCDVSKQFSTAGDHVTLENQHHGVMVDGGPHAGDLPNIWVNDDGVGKAEFFTPLIKMTDLQDANGTSLVVHAGADDYKSQPSGNSGDRIACGPLMKK
jgi:Cu-Zn family superoxide dismutase